MDSLSPMPPGTQPDTQPQQDAPVSRDASYKISYLDEGVFIEVAKEQGDGAPLWQPAILYDIDRRNLTEVNQDTLKLSLRRTGTGIKVAEPQQAKPVDADVFVEISGDEMSATMMLLAPALSGRHRTADEILETIKNQWKVVSGINEELVRAAVQNKSYYRSIVFAQGQPAVKGKDGEIVFLFNTEQKSIAPKILEDGSADYKSLHLFESVTEGTQVAVLVPPEDGADGRTVTGKVLPAQKGAERKLPKGRNVDISPDGRALVAAKSGRVDFINGRIEISNILKINGNVDMGVGNVEFEGDIMVQGNVISGLTLQAAGTIEVRGYVEAATLIAGKDIVLRNGMQGMSQGKLEAGGNIVARFIERATVSAKGDIVADYMVQCMVMAGGSVTMRGKWGKVLGGVIRAGKDVTARIIGSPSNDRTQFELGVLPDERARYTKLDAEKGQIKAQLNRVNNILGVMPAGDLPPDKQAMRDKLVNASQQLEEQYSALLLEIEELRLVLSTNSGARINVLKTIYPNVRIQIDSGVLVTNSSIEFATFRCQNGEIIFNACEVKS